MNINDRVNNGLDKIAAVIAIATGIFHILNVAGILTLSSMTLRVIHLMGKKKIL